MNSAVSDRPRWEALLLILLTLARIRIDTLAEAAVLPWRQQDVARHPWLGQILSPQAMTLLAQQQLTDPIGLLLIVVAVGCLLGYLLVVEFVHRPQVRHRVCLALIWTIVLASVCAPTMKLVLLRQLSGPASYSHDGGVIQTEATIDFLLGGRNPYAEDYLATPMAEWGISEFRTALYHYPYLPWTFLFSAPFKLFFQAVLGWYDQRLVYLLLFVVTLLLVPGLVVGQTGKRVAVMLLGLNPIMGSDVIFGQNDSFVLAWMVLSLWLWHRGRRQAGSSDHVAVWPGQGGGGTSGYVLAAAACFGLACASKPTAWFFAPFYLLLAAGEPTDLWRRPRAWLSRAFRVAWPAVAVAVAIVGPYFVWDPVAMWDDVWRWANGTAATAYQIWGWGASNVVLALGWVENRFVYWPFWVPQLVLGVPLLIGLLRHQMRDNRLGRALWGYGLFLLAFFFVSRFLNENYLGYIAAVLALGALADGDVV